MKMNDKGIINESLIENKIYYEQLKEQLQCTLCHNLLNEPLMCSSCETPFCRQCINVRKVSNTVCPSNCANAVYVEIPRLFRQLLDGLKLNCKYGCKVSLLNYKQHIELCEIENKEVVCWNCEKVNIKQSELNVKEEDYLNLIKENKEVYKKEKIINSRQKKKIENLENENNILTLKIIDLENELKSVNSKLSKKIEAEIANPSRDK